MRPAKILLLLGSLLAGLVGAGLLVGGGTLLWAHTTQREDGWYTTATERLETTTFALTSEHIDLGASAGEWLPVDDVGTVRFRAEAADSAGVFIGIAATEDVDRYLAESAHDEVTEVSFSPFDARYTRQEGVVAPAVPGAQTFWAASAGGGGQQTLTWDMEQGDWSIVIMKEDAATDVVVDVSAGVRTGLLLPIGLGLGIVGALLLGGALLVILLVFVIGRPAPPNAPQVAGPVTNAPPNARI